MQKDFNVVVIGSDALAYNFLRSVYEAYRIKPYLLGKISMAFTNTSHLYEQAYYVENLHDSKVFLETLIELANKLKAKEPEKDIVLIPTNDNYVQLTADNREELAKYYKFHIPSTELIYSFMKKDKFYPLAEKYGLPIPETAIKNANDDISDLENITYPVVIKPADAVEYYKHDFEGQAKVFFLDTFDEVKGVFHKIARSGYNKNLIVQELIPGADIYNFDCHSYTNQVGDMQFITFSQVLLGEPFDTATGNIAAQITRYNPELMDKIKDFLQALDYRGFADADIKLDPRTGEFKVFEINVRSGRSGYYIDQMGGSLAKSLIEDLVYDNRKSETHYFNEPLVSSFIPKGCIKRYVEDSKTKEEALALIDKGKFYNPLKCPLDGNLKRRIFLFLRDINYYRKFRQ